MLTFDLSAHNRVVSYTGVNGNISTKFEVHTTTHTGLIEVIGPTWTWTDRQTDGRMAPSLRNTTR